MKPTLAEFMNLLAENIEGLEFENIKPDTDFKEAEGWDSMHALLIMALLETEFDVTMKVEQMKNCKTVNDLYNIIP
jgi:acyl carrier protein